VGLSVDSDAGKMPRRTVKYFSECAICMFVGTLFSWAVCTLRLFSYSKHDDCPSSCVTNCV